MCRDQVSSPTPHSEETACPDSCYDLCFISLQFLISCNDLDSYVQSQRMRLFQNKGIVNGLKGFQKSQKEEILREKKAAVLGIIIRW